MKKLLIVFLAFSCISQTIAQNNINDYKYVIVPYKYDFVNEKDKYQLNSLSQFLFNKYGFEAIMEDADFPSDLGRNRCLGLRSDVIKEKGAFVTKLRVELKNCNNEVVYTTKIGASREKDYKIGYTLALREAFNDFEYVNYKYQPNESILAKATVDTNESTSVEVLKLKEELNALKEKQLEVKEVPQKELIEEKVPAKEAAVVAVVIQEEPEVKKVVVEETSTNVLYAQKIDNGYQIVDKTPKVVMILLETTKADVYLVKDDYAIVYKEDGFWYLSKNDGNKATIETLNIKF